MYLGQNVLHSIFIWNPKNTFCLHGHTVDKSFFFFFKPPVLNWFAILLPRNVISAFRYVVTLPTQTVEQCCPLCRFSSAVGGFDQSVPSLCPFRVSYTIRSFFWLLYSGPIHFFFFFFLNSREFCSVLAELKEHRVGHRPIRVQCYVLFECHYGYWH